MGLWSNLWYRLQYNELSLCPPQRRQLYPGKITLRGCQLQVSVIGYHASKAYDEQGHLGNVKLVERYQRSYAAFLAWPHCSHGIGLHAKAHLCPPSIHGKGLADLVMI